MKKKANNNQATLNPLPQGPGASQNQISTFTARISHLTEHLKYHKKDHSCKRGLMSLVSKRSRLMRYLQRTNPSLYNQTRKDLRVRK